MIDLRTKTGKHKGSIINTEVATIVGLTEGAIRNLEKKHPKRYKILYLGALCKANNIDEMDLEEFIENAKKN